jgi:hypothetical protein
MAGDEEKGKEEEAPAGGRAEILKTLKGIGGQDCCRQVNEPCGAPCRVIWRIWIFLLSLQLMVRFSVKTIIGLGWQP